MPYAPSLQGIPRLEKDNNNQMVQFEECWKNFILF